MNIIYPFTVSFLDYLDNESIAVVVYIMGCEHKCKNCHNKQFADVDYEKSVNVNKNEFIKLIKKATEKNRTNKIVLSGGDPLYKSNINDIISIIGDLKDEYDIMIYTGYDIDYVKKNNISGFKYIKCGVYDENQKQTSFKDDDKFVFASKNQKLYDSKYNLISNNGVFNFNNKE